MKPPATNRNKIRGKKTGEKRKVSTVQSGSSQTVIPLSFNSETGTRLFSQFTANIIKEDVIFIR
jgi:hypothetical protein